MNSCFYLIWNFYPFGYLEKPTLLHNIVIEILRVSSHDLPRNLFQVRDLSLPFHFILIMFIFTKFITWGNHAYFSSLQS